MKIQRQSEGVRQKQEASGGYRRLLQRKAPMIRVANRYLASMLCSPVLLHSFIITHTIVKTMTSINDRDAATAAEVRTV
jgi:hypothetical protein